MLFLRGDFFESNPKSVILVVWSCDDGSRLASTYRRCGHGHRDDGTLRYGSYHDGSCLRRTIVFGIDFVVEGCEFRYGHGEFCSCCREKYNVVVLSARRYIVHIIVVFVFGTYKKIILCICPCMMSLDFFSCLIRAIPVRSMCIFCYMQTANEFIYHKSRKRLHE